MNLWQRPPAFLLCGFRLAEALADHLHQVVQLLIGLVLLDECGDFSVVQPVMFTAIKQVEHLGVELFVPEIVLEVDVLARRDAHTDKASAARGIHQRLLLVGGADKRGITPELLDGLAVGRTELHLS